MEGRRRYVAGVDLLTRFSLVNWSLTVGIHLIPTSAVFSDLKEASSQPDHRDRVSYSAYCRAAALISEP